MQCTAGSGKAAGCSQAFLAMRECNRGLRPPARRRGWRLRCCPGQAGPLRLSHF